MRTVFFIFIIAGLCSCIKELEYTVKETPKVLVLNGVLKANHPITVHVSGLQSVLDTTLNLINDALVILQENGVVIDTMRSKGMGYFHTQKLAFPGNVYKLRVSADGYQTVFATEMVPLQTLIAEARSSISDTFDEDGNQNTEYVIKIKDIPTHESYFDFFIVEEIFTSDSVFHLRFTSSLFISDPLFEEAGVNDNLYFSFLFNNKSINSQDYTLKFTARPYGTGSYTTYKESLFFNKMIGDVAVLRTISKSYFDYRLSWSKHKMFQNDSMKIEYLITLPLLGEPSEMYSNIENGLGVFIAYNQHYLKID